ncbi:P-loop containing nucleoside triphosphate hydrolase protein [Aspergillus unguis]
MSGLPIAAFSVHLFIGYHGVDLSGGQKQRVSLARALYLHSDFLVLDDVFSGLDADTEEQVFQQVFGPNGLLRERSTAVVLCIHSVRRLPAFDYVIVLQIGTVIEQGGFDDLLARPGYIQHFGLELKQERIGSSGVLEILLKGA